MIKKSLQLTFACAWKCFTWQNTRRWLSEWLFVNFKKENSWSGIFAVDMSGWKCLSIYSIPGLAPDVIEGHHENDFSLFAQRYSLRTYAMIFFSFLVFIPICYTVKKLFWVTLYYNRWYMELAESAWESSIFLRNLKKKSRSKHGILMYVCHRSLRARSVRSLIIFLVLEYIGNMRLANRS